MSINTPVNDHSAESECPSGVWPVLSFQGQLSLNERDYGSIALVSPPSNRTIAMHRAHLFWANRCELEAEKANG